MPKSRKHSVLDGEPLWYKDAVIYEMHVRAFSDSNEDGVGDFRGLTGKLDYLQGLGVTAVWLLPFCPSPWKDDGYDISDYTNIHPAYGTMRDFQAFLRAAHSRGLRVITELVLNHTSDKHPWFQRSRNAKPGSRWRNFYVWSDSPEKYREARIIFKDFESSNWTWDPVAKAYYWHRFYAHQPDLNFDNPSVRRAVMQAVDFWFELGVDGLRLDAVPYLFERDGTDCENLEETHGFLKDLRRHIDSKYENRMLLGEANQWPEDAVAYFGSGDECHMAFHFPLMPRLFMAHMREDRYPILDILAHTPQIPETCQWALFLRNHDELTLEMVTDEERDYMYRAYANDRQARINLGIRRRLAPLLGNHHRRIELMNALLFTLPGTPVIYYGDEIGMGDNIYLGDRNGVRTPMQWNADRNAGFSRSNPQRLYLPVIIDPEYHYEALNVEAQQNNPHSLLWWMKRLIALRRQSKALSRGSIEFLEPDNHKVLAFFREYGEERLLVVANLSRFSQPVELDMQDIKGFRPVEMFGRIPFPSVGDVPYLLTMAPHSFYLFIMEEPEISGGLKLNAEGALFPTLQVSSIESIFKSNMPAEFLHILPDYLAERRWFRGKARNIRSVRVAETIPVIPGKSNILFVEVDYSDGHAEYYLLPLSLATGDEIDRIKFEAAHAVLVCLKEASGAEGLVYSGTWDPEFCETVLDAIGRKRRFRGRHGELRALSSRAFRQAMEPADSVLESRIQKSEQSNTSIIFSDSETGDRAILKFFRCLEKGPNPDLEVGKFLTESASYQNSPDVLGSLEYRGRGDETETVAILHGFIPNECDAWNYTLDSFGRYLDLALSSGCDAGKLCEPDSHPLELAGMEFTDTAVSLMNDYLQDAGLMGQRTAELHQALCRNSTKPEFSPEPFTDFYRNGLYHGIAVLVDRTFQLLKKKARTLTGETRSLAQQVINRESEVRAGIGRLRKMRISAVRIRHHGDFHLGQILFTGKDFFIIDFEGEPARPIGERRIKRSPLRDVAGMLRSFHYASSAARFGLVPGVLPREGNGGFPDFWARFWYSNAAAAYLKGYFKTAGGAPFIPHSAETLRILLDVFLIEKAVYEISYELNNRPEWLGIPLQGILDLLKTGKETGELA